ncbi:ATP synthase F0 subunit A [Candidatus Marinamargulisbacteria bacterium SCGC AG-439-L15]|nr:ATP synthase F0 subunit A [Candidatus Marinamargulisbacteria bacterium SCGC AG-439-L15]
MEKIGKVSLTTFNLFGHEFQLNMVTIGMTWVTIGLIIFAGYLICKNLKTIPSGIQSIGELIYEFIEDLTLGTLGKKEGKPFVPFIFTLFIFILLSNWIGIIPNIPKLLGCILAVLHKVIGGNSQLIFEGITAIKLTPDPSAWYAFLFKVPDFEEPTRSISTDLAMGLMVFVVVHVNAVRKNGFLGYLKGYWGDVMPCEGKWLLLAPVNIMIPLNIIGEVSSVVSHSFRLFGNIFGGFMIITIVSSLIKFLVIPIGLLAFFGLFAGLVQAFVFTMLAITYIGQKV